MDIESLPPDLAQFVDAALASGRYASSEALFCDALQALREQEYHHSASLPADEPPSNHSPRSPDDYLDALAQALRVGEFGRARQLAIEGAERYPTHHELQKCAYVLAPPLVRTVPASAASRASVKANNAWMKDHWHEYPGQWVAVRDGHFVHAAASFDELVAAVGDTHGVLLTKIHG